MKQSKKMPSRKERMAEKAKQKNLGKNSKKQKVAKEKEEDDALDFNQEGKYQQVDVSFVIAQIRQSQYHSLKTILQKYSTMTSVTSSQWSDLIIKNAKTGNVAVADEQDDQQNESEEQNSDSESEERQSEHEKPEDDEENVCSGVLALLPSKSKEVKSVMKKMITSAEKAGKIIKKINEGQNNSLLINERAINLPAFVVQNMHEVLVKDLESLKEEDAETYEKVCSGYVWVSSWVQKKKEKQQNLQNLVYSKFEDYEMLKKSKFWWLGESVPGIVQKGDLRKLYYIIKWENYMQGVKNLKHLLIDE